LDGLAPEEPTPVELDRWTRVAVDALDGVQPSEWTEPEAWGDEGWPDARSVASTTVVLRWPELWDDTLRLVDHWDAVRDANVVVTLLGRLEQVRTLSVGERAMALGAWAHSGLGLELDAVAELGRIQRECDATEEDRVRVALVLAHTQMGLEQHNAARRALANTRRPPGGTLAHAWDGLTWSLASDADTDPVHPPRASLPRRQEPAAIALASLEASKLRQRGFPKRAANHLGRLNRRLSLRLGQEHYLSVTVLQGQGSALNCAGRARGALKRAQHVSRIVARWSPRGSGVDLQARFNLATAYSNAGRLEEALDATVAGRSDATRRLGPEHPMALLWSTALAHIEARQGRHDKAIELLSAAVSGLLKQGHFDSFILGAATNLATFHRRGGNTEAAWDIALRTWEQARDWLGLNSDAARASALLLARLATPTPSRLPPGVRQHLRDFLATDPAELESSDARDAHAQLQQLATTGLLDPPSQDASLKTLLAGSLLNLPADPDSTP